MISNNFISEKFLDEKYLKKLQIEFSQAQPFEHISLDELFKEEKLQKLAQALTQEQYYIEDHDLYQFLRTTDFKHTNNNTIKEFREFLLSKEFMSLIQTISNSKLQEQKLDLHSLKLENGHYLLCHDDQVQQRAFAFIINLTKDWQEGDGGELELFSSNEDGTPKEVTKRIAPRFGRFNMFKVSTISYHQIAEVQRDIERTSLGGWYYLAKSDSDLREEKSKNTKCNLKSVSLENEGSS